MKTATTLLFMLLFTVAHTQSVLRIPEQEHLVLNVHLDYAKTNNPETSAYGLDYVIEAGYSGFVEAKVGIESFSKLPGGYFGFHGAIGIKMTAGYFEQWNFYSGIRLMKIYRTGPRLGKTFRAQAGYEAQITYDVSDIIYIGARYTLDERLDMQIMDWEPINVSSVFITIGFKIKDLRP